MSMAPWWCGIIIRAKSRSASPVKGTFIATCMRAVASFIMARKPSAMSGFRSLGRAAGATAPPTNSASTTRAGRSPRSNRRVFMSGPLRDERARDRRVGEVPQAIEVGRQAERLPPRVFLRTRRGVDTRQENRVGTEEEAKRRLLFRGDPENDLGDLRRIAAHGVGIVAEVLAPCADGRLVLAPDFFDTHRRSRPVGAHAAGLDDGHANAERADLLRQDLGETSDGPLCRLVGAEPGEIGRAHV